MHVYAVAQAGEFWAHADDAGVFDIMNIDKDLDKLFKEGQFWYPPRLTFNMGGFHASIYHLQISRSMQKNPGTGNSFLTRRCTREDTRLTPKSHMFLKSTCKRINQPDTSVRFEPKDVFAVVCY